jgi:putative FmdB family regulatory protein
MPTYEYECKSCGHSFDIFQSMSDEPLKICPQCGNEIRRIINGGTGVIFKGSGFYVTDKKEKSGSRTDSSGKTAPKTPAPDSSGKAESAGSSSPRNSSPPEAGSEKKAAG